MRDTEIVKRGGHAKRDAAPRIGPRSAPLSSGLFVFLFLGLVGLYSCGSLYGVDAVEMLHKQFACWNLRSCCLNNKVVQNRQNALHR